MTNVLIRTLDGEELEIVNALSVEFDPAGWIHVKDRRCRISMPTDMVYAVEEVFDADQSAPQ